MNRGKLVFAQLMQHLRNFGERGQVTNLDRCLRLRSGRHRQKALASLGQPI